MRRWFRPSWLFGRPDVVVDFEFDAGALYLAVSNHGSRSAHDVSTRFDPTFHDGDGREIPALSLFDRIGYLPPGKTIRTFVDPFEAYVRRGEPTVVESTVRFHGRNGRRLENAATHDLGIYRDLAYSVGDNDRASGFEGRRYHRPE